MHTITFEERAKALENAFFQRVDDELLARLRCQIAERNLIDGLRAASGITDEKLLTELARIGVGPETLSAVSLIPLVMVAWADGKLDEDELRPILAAEREAGVSEEDPSHQLLEHWLTERPDDELLETWKHFVTALNGELGDACGDLLNLGIFERARKVALASGGAFGYGRISPGQRRVLDEVQQAFAARSRHHVS